MINKIVTNINKTKRDVFLIDVLMNQIHNQMLQDKWIFTMNTYHNLLDNIDLFLNQNVEQIIKNFIVNDYETLSQMIDEFKEDIYPYFNSQIFMLLDSLNNDELLEMSIHQKNIFNCGYSYSNCIKQILVNDIENIKAFSKDLYHFSLNNIVENDLKFIPLNQLKEISNTTFLSIDQYIYIYQVFNKTLKYIIDKSEFINQYNKIKYNALIMMIGDINV